MVFILYRNYVLTILVHIGVWMSSIHLEGKNSILFMLFRNLILKIFSFTYQFGYQASKSLRFGYLQKFNRIHVI